MAASLCAADTRTRVRKSIAKNPERGGGARPSRPQMGGKRCFLRIVQIVFVSFRVMRPRPDMTAMGREADILRQCAETCPLHRR